MNTDLSPERMAEILTDTGLEVEGLQKIEAVKGGLEGVFVGEVLSCKQHPDADRLKVTTVSAGGDELQIVCGAPNVAVGQKVIVATVGCTLYPILKSLLRSKNRKSEELNRWECFVLRMSLVWENRMMEFWYWMILRL